SAQLLFQIAKWSAHGRRESKKKPAQRGNAKGKQKHVPIEANFFRTRQSTRPHLYKRTDAVRRDKHAEQSSRESQHSAFGQALAHQPAAAGSKCRAHRKFTLP